MFQLTKAVSTGPVILSAEEQEILGRVSEDHMRKVVESLSFSRHWSETEANVKAREIVVSDFKESGFTPIFSGRYTNVVVGHAKKGKLIGAHYDSVLGTPGADDNASAVAVMLMVAKALGPSYKDVTYVAFNREEDNLLGSRDFVMSGHVDQSVEAHILEMVGFTGETQENPLPGILTNVPSKGDFLAVLSNAKMKMAPILALAGECIQTPVYHLPVPAHINMNMLASHAPNLLRSDHAPFWLAGMAATMWTDTAEYRNKNYHQLADTPDRLNYKFMADMAKLLILTVLKG
jgi:hypothetical protein